MQQTTPKSIFQSERVSSLVSIQQTLAIVVHEACLYEMPETKTPYTFGNWQIRPKVTEALVYAGEDRTIECRRTNAPWVWTNIYDMSTLLDITERASLLHAVASYVEMCQKAVEEDETMRGTQSATTM